MIHPNLKHKNKLLYWFPMDTEELFQENLLKRKDELEEHGWLNTEVGYEFDELGYRKQIKNDYKEQILFLGCSFTFGVGLDYKDSFTNLVADDLGMNNINRSIPGSSNDTAFRLCKDYLAHEKPRIVIFTSPNPYRLELFSKQNEKIISHNVTSTMCDPELPDTTRLPIYLFDDTFSTLNREKNSLAIEMLCVKNNIKFLHLRCEDMPWIDLGRDLKHPGVKSNRLFADNILKKLRKISL